MPVNAKSVQGRRDLSFQVLDDIVKDAELLVAAPNTRTLGNWPLERLLTHLASTIDSSIDGFQIKAPLYVRLIVPFFKNKFLKARKMDPGINLPKGTESAAFPEAKSPQEALEQLRKAVARAKTERMQANHPGFGKMTHDEWVIMHLRHSEMHLSFAVPR